MKKNTKANRLHLKKETVRNLTPDQMQSTAGGTLYQINYEVYNVNLLGASIYGQSVGGTIPGPSKSG